MKLSMPVDALSSITSVMAKVTAEKVTQPILKSILIDATGPELLLRVVCLDHALQVKVTSQHVRVQEIGRALVECNRFNTMIRDNKKMDVSLRTDHKKHQLVVQFGTSRAFTVPLERAEDFPEPPVINADAYFKVSARVFTDMVDHVRKNVSKLESRRLMHGIAIQLGDDGLLKVVATDGMRLSVASHQLAEPPIAPAQVVIYPDFIDRVSDLVTSADEQVMVSVDQRYVMFAGSVGTLYVRRIEGTYPPYEMALRAQLPYVVELERAAAYDTVKQSTKIDWNGILPTIQLSFENNKLTWTAQCATGTFFEEQVIDWRHPKLVMFMNPTMLLAALDAMTEKTVAITVGKSYQAFMLREKSCEGQVDFVTVCMPLRPEKVAEDEHEDGNEPGSHGD